MRGRMDRQRRRELGEAIEEVAEPERVERRQHRQVLVAAPRDRGRRPSTSPRPRRGSAETARRSRKRERERRRAGSAAVGSAGAGERYGAPPPRGRKQGSRALRSIGQAGPRGEERRQRRAEADVRRREGEPDDDGDQADALRASAVRMPGARVRTPASTAAAYEPGPAPRVSAPWKTSPTISPKRSGGTESGSISLSIASPEPSARKAVAARIVGIPTSAAPSRA